MTDRVALTKSHGLGNDFLVALEVDNPGLVPDPNLAVRWCHRHRGIGADGVLFGLAPTESDADLDMVLFNADGTEAEISGNGIRCLGQAGLRSTGRRDGTIVIDGTAGRWVLECSPTEDPATDLIRVDMGVVGPGPNLGPVASSLACIRTGSAGIGNPHVVIQVEHLDALDIAEIGPRVETETAGGTNVHLMAVVGPDRISLRHWERGVGLTEACGSGATVSAALAHRWGLVSERVVVDMPGGQARVEIGERLSLIGPATEIARIEVAGG